MTTPPLVTPCMMFSKYEQEFPPLERKIDRKTQVATRPYCDQTQIDHEGKVQPTPTPAEEVLNWQTSNARVQNRVLQDIDQKVDEVLTHVKDNSKKVAGVYDELDHIYNDTVARIKELDRSLRYIIDYNNKDPTFYQKEREIRRLKKEVEFMEHERASRFAPPPTYSRYPSSLSSFLTDPTPRLDYPHQFSSLPAVPFHRSPPRRRYTPSREEFSREFTSRPSASQMAPPEVSPDRKQKAKVDE